MRYNCGKVTGVEVAQLPPAQRLAAIERGVGAADQLVEIDGHGFVGEVTLGEGEVRGDGAVEPAELGQLVGGEAGRVASATRSTSCSMRCQAGRTLLQKRIEIHGLVT